jgi:hypothetical protein
MLAVLVVAAGCGGSGAETRGTVFGDTILVDNPRPLFPDTAELVLSLRIGTLDGSPELEFGSITAFAVDDAGSVYVYDRDSGLRHFDPTGRFVSWIARPGEGPREVGCAHALAARRGRVAVDDTCNRRISIFGSDFSVVSGRRP